MSQRRRAGSKKELAPGHWRLWVSEGLDPVSGKRRRISETFYGDDRESDLELARMLARAGRHATSTITLWEFIDTMYLPEAEAELRERTVAEYRRKLEKHVKGSPIGGMRLDKLTRYSMVSWMRGVKNVVPNKQTQLHIYSNLSAALGKAIMWGLLDENLLRMAVEPPVPDEVFPVALTEDEANAYLDAFAGHEMEPLVVLGIAAGLRPSETYALTWRDIDLQAGEVSVTKGLHQRRGKVWTEPPKSRESKRTVKIPDWAIEALKLHRGVGPVFGSLTPNQISWQYRKHATDMGLKPWCPPENLRHTYGTIAAERGADMNALKGQMGHTSTKMLDTRYAKRRVLRSGMVAEAMENVRKMPPAEERKVK